MELDELVLEAAREHRSLRGDGQYRQKTLREQHFREAAEEGAPLCRWVIDEVRVDVMPLDPAILGFSNVWYVGAHGSALPIDSDDGTIRILDAPHFCATKLEAFFSRGDGDLYHHDLEDFIAIVDGRATLVDEIAASPEDLRDFLARETVALLARAAFVEALPGHLDPDVASQSRLPVVLARLRAIAELAHPQDSQLAAPPAPSTRPSAPTPPGILRGPLTPFSSRAPRVDLDHVFMRSSNLYGASYDGQTSTLVIQFNNGSQYAYSGVPATIYSGLLRAASAGRYHHQVRAARTPFSTGHA